MSYNRILEFFQNGGPMRVAHIDFGHRPIFLAPMEDVSDPPFRRLCKRYGADMLYTEFISSGGLVHDADNSVMKLDILLFGRIQSGPFFALLTRTASPQAPGGTASGAS